MVKKMLYPKTRRVSTDNSVLVTEKMDGSNLCFFKLDGELHIAQRNNIYSLKDLCCEQSVKGVAYPGLSGWIALNGERLQSQLVEGAALCGEWIGMGAIKYPSEFRHNFYMFAKANIDESLELYNFRYTPALFIYPFENQEVPDFIRVVPQVARLQNAPTVEELDHLYEEYCKQVDRPVEGFVLALQQDSVRKYVRMKRGKLEPHME